MLSDTVRNAAGQIDELPNWWLRGAEHITASTSKRMAERQGAQAREAARGAYREAARLDRQARRAGRAAEGGARGGKGKGRTGGADEDDWEDSEDEAIAMEEKELDLERGGLGSPASPSKAGGGGDSVDHRRLMTRPSVRFLKTIDSERGVAVNAQQYAVLGECSMLACMRACMRTHVWEHLLAIRRCRSRGASLMPPTPRLPTPCPACMRAVTDVNQDALVCGKR